MLSYMMSCGSTCTTVFIMASGSQEVEIHTCVLLMCGSVLQASCWRAKARWTRAYLRKAFKGQKIVAGNYSMSFEDYLAYTDASTDDMPLYLFDCDFAHKAPQLAADYEVEFPALQTSVLLPGKRHVLHTADWRLAFVCAGHSWITASTARIVGPCILPEDTPLYTTYSVQGQSQSEGWGSFSAGYPDWY